MKMGFKAALIAALLCSCAPAYAAVAIITGSDTGGALGHNSVSGSTTIAVTTAGAAAPAGSLIVAMPAASAALTWSGCTDSASNTYTAALANTLNSTFTARMFYTVAANNLPIGGTVTCTANSGSAVKTMVVAAFSGLSASPLDASSVTGTGSSTSLAVGPTGTLNYSGGSNGEVLLGFVSTGATGNWTQDAAFVDLGTFLTAGNTQVRSAFAYKIVSASTAITYTPVNSSSGAYAGNLGAFIGTAGGAASLGRRSLLGVGN